MSSVSVTQRIQTLSDTYKATLSLIQELQKFPNGGSSSTDDLDEQRLDLANTCHESLKSAEESLELLRQEVDDYDGHMNRRRLASPRNEEQERNATTVARLAEDIRSARGAFRRAQLQSKKNLDARKQKEREQLFANRRTGANGSATAPGRQRGHEKLTQDELAQDAAEDVTRALRRTHALLTSNLQQSQFAQQTLEESQEQLQGLSERYTGTTDMLLKSRTIAWLVFRRWLYGPLWWFVWLPLKLVWWGFAFVFGGSAATKGTDFMRNDTMAVTSQTGLGVSDSSMKPQRSIQPFSMYGAGQKEPKNPEAEVPPSPETVEHVKKLIDEAKEGTTVAKEDDDQPRNPKKRMMELEKEQASLREEL
ncbi:Protein transport protein sec20 [Lithohypha guttulata]|uniref:Protein transport protein sec20 n=1 Tax=Lithohypha guttulata TaxID=1690604 RepID=UPI002DE0CB34|nr:Protein transport protein sec20 [Lithohypha guttulata]